MNVSVRKITKKKRFYIKGFSDSSAKVKMGINFINIQKIS